ncbi:MAG: DUF86 domain-containing protein [Candidatus Njordarchaeales archaeon]
MGTSSFFSEESIESRLRKAEEALGVLKKLAELTFDEFASNLINVYAAKGALLIISQVIIDISNLLIASKDLGVPTSREEVISILESYEILPEDIAEKLEDLIKVRDKILHSHEIVGEKALYEKILGNIELLEKALGIIQKEIRSPSTG